MSDTPRTNAVEEAWDHLCLPRIIWNHARELERKNAALCSNFMAAESEIILLREERDRLREDKARLDSGTIALIADGGRRCVWYGRDLRAAIDDARKEART